MKYKQVKSVIDEWDPVDLLIHAPADEYDSESREIAEKVSPMHSVESIGQTVYQVFLNSFGPNTFDKNLNECIEIAHRIKNI